MAAAQRLFIEDLPGRYRLHIVPHNRPVDIIEWSKELLDKGKEHTQDDWIIALQNQEFNLPSPRLYFSTLCSLYQNKDGPQSDLVKSILRMFQEDFKQSLMMMTSARVYYNPRSPDAVIHNFKTAEEKIINTEIAGFHDDINKPISDTALCALLDTSDLTEIDLAHRRISKGKQLLWRLGYRPNNIEKRCVVVGGDYNHYPYINANIDLDQKTRARGGHRGL